MYRRSASLERDTAAGSFASLRKPQLHPVWDPAYTTWASENCWRTGASCSVRGTTLKAGACESQGTRARGRPDSRNTPRHMDLLLADRRGLELPPRAASTSGRVRLPDTADISIRILHVREPPHPGHRHLRQGHCPAGRGHGRQGGIDIGHVHRADERVHRLTVGGRGPAPAHQTPVDPWLRGRAGRYHPVL